MSTVSYIQPALNHDLLKLNSLSQLVKLYNLYSDSPVKSFKDKPTALIRCVRLAGELGMVAAREDDVTILKAPPVTAAAQVVATPAPAPAPQPAAQVAEPATAPTPAAPKPPAASKPVSPATPDVVRRRGPVPRMADDWVITVCVDANPKRQGADNYARFELYRTGMTVGGFLDAAAALSGGPRGRWRGDIAWDMGRGFITVLPPKRK